MLSEVSSENALLKEEINTLKPVREFINSVEMRCGEQVVPFRGLDEARVGVEEGQASDGEEGAGQVDMLMGARDERISVPLSTFAAVRDDEQPGSKLFISNILAGLFPFPEYPVVHEVHDSSVLVMIFGTTGTASVFVRGLIENLSGE